MSIWSKLRDTLSGGANRVRSIVASAAALRVAGDLAGAAAQLREAARLAPRRAEVHADLGLLLIEMGEFAEAESVLTQAVEVADDETRGPLVNHRYLAGALKEGALDRPGYRKVLQVLGTSDDDDPGKSSAAREKRCRALVESYPSLALPLLMLAQLEADGGRHSKAIDLLDRARTASPPLPDDRLRELFANRRSWYLSARPELGEALDRSVGLDSLARIAALEELARIHPEFAQLRVLLGSLHLAQGLLELAEIHLSVAVALDPTDLKGWLGLGDAMMRSNRPCRAREAYAAALVVSAESKEVAARLESANKILAAHPEAVELEAGLELLAGGRAEEAVGLLRAALSKAPSNPHIKFYLARALLRTGEPEESSELLAEVRGADPEDLAVELLVEEEIAILVGALRHADRGELEQALEALDAGVGTMPAAELLRDVRSALQRVMQGAVDHDSFRAFEAALAWHGLDVNERLELLDRALGVAPDLLEARLVRGVVRLDRLELNGALADLRKVGQEHPSHPAALLAIGGIHILQGARKDARRSWRSCAELGTTHSELARRNLDALDGDPPFRVTCFALHGQAKATVVEGDRG